MHQSIRILHLEDDAADAQLVEATLESAGLVCRITRFQTREEFDEALRQGGYHVILADYRLPTYDGMSALRLAQQLARDVPFIFVSGTMGEDAAIEGLRDGATDYVLKQKLSRLVPAVKRALVEAENQRERRRAEAAVSHLSHQMELILSSAGEGIFGTDINGNVTFANPAMTRMVGWEISELLGQSAHDLWHHTRPDGRQPYPIEECPMRLAFQNDRTYHADDEVFWRKDGTSFPVEFTSTPIREGDRMLGTVVVIKDITERKRAEQERMRLATAIEQSAEGMFIADTNWIIQYTNPAFERMTGYGKHEIIGQHTRILKSERHDRAFYRKIRETLALGEVWSGRLNNKRKDGTIYEADVTASPVRDNSGAIMNYVSIHRDITHEVRLERQLRQAQKMEAIGTLAGGIAHDFNNILAAIIGFSEMALSKIDQGSPLRHNLEMVLDAGSRATDLVRQILTFSRQTEQERRPMQIGRTVKEALKLLRSSLPTTIEIRQEHAISPRQDIVLADPTQVHQLLMNLCTNAAHAMRARGGLLSVRVWDTFADASLVSRHPDLGEGPYVVLTVSDTGHGMNGTIMERIFDPYFTTKGIGEGTGLGLAVVQGIVQSYGGAITVYSEPGKGTTFHVFLPKIQAEIVPEPEVDKVLPTGSERILFIDDEKALAELGKEMLESLGYNVTAKTNSLEALETFRAQPAAFDLVITDMTMPELTGKDLANELLAIRADLPVILCSGLSELINMKQAKEKNIREFLMKPYVTRNLANVIRKVLGQR